MVLTLVVLIVPVVLIVLVCMVGLLWRRAAQERRLLERLTGLHGRNLHSQNPHGGNLQGEPALQAAAGADAPALALQLPEPHRLYALALLCRLQDLRATPQQASTPLQASTAFLIEQARTDYLPKTLRAYLATTPAVRASLAAQGVSGEQLLREQLELINQGLNDALRQDYAAAQHILTQGTFLREVFRQGENIRV